MQFFSKISRLITTLVRCSVFFAALALLLGAVTFIIDIEDKQSERLFSAWRYVIENDRLTREYMAKNEVTAPMISIRNIERVLE